MVISILHKKLNMCISIYRHMHSKSNPTFDMVKGIQAFLIFQIECITYRPLYQVTILFCMFDNHFSSSFNYCFHTVHHRGDVETC